MRLGTQVGLFNPRQGSDQPKNTIHMMEQCVAAGFTVLDIGFCDAIRPGKPDDLSPYDWEHRIDDIGEAAARLGVEFSQAHLPYADLFLYSKPCEERTVALFREMTRRGVIACGRLGVKWAVVHPFTDTIHAEFDNEVNLATNPGVLHALMLSWPRRTAPGLPLKIWLSSAWRRPSAAIAPLPTS